MPSRKKSRSPYRYNRKNNLLKQTSKRRSKSRSKSRSTSRKKKKSPRKRYSSSVPKSKKNKSRSPRKLVDINDFQYRRKYSPKFRVSPKDGFQTVRGRRKSRSRKLQQN